MKKLIPQLFLLICFVTTTFAAISSTNPIIQNIQTTTADTRPKYRIGFDAPQINHRQLLLTIDENTTDAVDWGYDGRIPQILADDMYWLIENDAYVIQGTNTINVGKEIPLGIVTTNGGAITIKVDALEYPIKGMQVGLKDTAFNTIHKLEDSNYQVTLPAGEYHNRFFIVFLSNVTSTTPPPPPGDTPIDTTITAPETGLETTTPPPPGDIIADTTETETTGTETTENQDPETDSDTTENEESTETDSEVETSKNKEKKHHWQGNNHTRFHHFNKNKLLIYVNNGQHMLNVKNKKGIKIHKIALFDRYGKQVKVWNNNLNSATIKFQLQVKRGIYMVLVKTNKGPVFKRVYIQNS